MMCQPVDAILFSGFSSDYIYLNFISYTENNHKDIPKNKALDIQAHDYIKG